MILWEKQAPDLKVVGLNPWTNKSYEWNRWPQLVHHPFHHHHWKTWSNPHRETIKGLKGFKVHVGFLQAANYCLFKLHQFASSLMPCNQNLRHVDASTFWRGQNHVAVFQRTKIHLHGRIRTKWSACCAVPPPAAPLCTARSVPQRFFPARSAEAQVSDGSRRVFLHVWHLCRRNTSVPVT